MRNDWNKYFMSIAKQVSTRSTCIKRQVGAVAVKDRRILATGYNGAPSGVRDCLEIGCERTNIPSGERIELCRAVHAEQNVIAQGAFHGISLKGAEIYCTHRPCYTCAKMLINCGITKIWYSTNYPDNLSEALLKEAGVRLIQMEE